MKLGEYASYDGLGLAELVRNGEVSPSELASLAGEAIGIVNPSINAVVETYEDHIGDLNEADFGDGPFRGVPLLIKDHGAFEKGRLRESGSRLLAGNRPAETSFLFDLFQASGVNVVGRTNVPEFCIAGTTEGVHHGNCSTPWKDGFSAGGSSGGAASAVAAGIVPVAHGSDIGGSIRIPASLCGGVGLKPSRGRVSTGPFTDEGGWGMAQNLVQTRTVRDTAAMLDCLGKPQPGDPFIIVQPERPFLSEVGASVGKLRVAVHTDPLGPNTVHPETAAAVKSVAQKLQDMGHGVETTAPAYDFASVMEAFIALWFVGYDKVIDGFAENMGRAIGPENLEPATLTIYEAAKDMGADDLVKGMATLNANRRAFGSFFETYDVWITPTTAMPSEPWGRYNQGLQGLTAREYVLKTEAPVQFCVPYNVSGFPAISLPLGQTADGLPIGVQIGTRHGGEALLIRIASALEIAMPWKDRVPPLHVSRLSA